MARNAVFLLLTARMRNFYGFIMERLDVTKFGLKVTSRIKAFVFRFISVPAQWIKTSRQHVLNIYTCNNAYAEVFQTKLLAKLTSFSFDGNCSSIYRVYAFFALKFTKNTNLRINFYKNQHNFKKMFGWTK